MRIEWLATVAHELRNPLAAIQCAVRVLDAPGQSPSMRQHARATIDRQIVRIARLSDDMLNIRHLAPGKLELRTERIDVLGIVDAAVDACRPQIDAGHHTVILRLPSTPIVIHADPVRLTQVLTNLIDNAAKYSDRNGRIVVSVVATRNDVAIRVTDRGIGIAAELLPRVFELFMQAEQARKRSPLGMGIGLSLVKCIVELHGGSVGVASAGAGSGCCFTVRLPLDRNR